VTAIGKPLQNVLWLVGERLARAAVTATVLGLVARHLQPEGFGRLSLAVTCATIAAALANLGLEGLVVNELINRPGQPGAVLGTAFRLRLGGGVAAAVLLGGLAFALDRSDAGLIAIVGLALLFQPAEAVDLWFQRHLDSRRTVVARSVGIMAGATLKLWLVARGAPLTAFAWAQVADAAFIALALGWAGRTSPHHAGPWTWDRDVARDFWRRGAPLALAAVVVALAIRLDQLLVRSWLGTTGATGLYFAASRLTDMALFAGAATTLSLFPSLAAGHRSSPQDYARRLQASFDALSAMGWIVALVCTFAGPWIVRLIYGPAYAAAAPVLAVQGWACLFALSAGLRWNFILLSAPPLLNLAAALLHVVTLLAVAAWLMPGRGLAGAALALLAANVVSGYVTSFLFPPLRACAGAQTRGLFIVFTPGRWPEMLRQFVA